MNTILNGSAVLAELSSEKNILLGLLLGICRSGSVRVKINLSII